MRRNGRLNDDIAAMPLILTFSFVVHCCKMLHHSINTTDTVQEDIVVSTKHKGTLQSSTIMRRNGRKYNNIVTATSIIDFFLCPVLL
jgi:hypothetical protein